MGTDGDRVWQTLRDISAIVAKQRGQRQYMPETDKKMGCNPEM